MIRIIYFGVWMLVATAIPVSVVALGVETDERTVEELGSWWLPLVVAVGVVVVVGFVISSFALASMRTMMGLLAFIGAPLGVVASFWADDRLFILSSVLAAPIYMFGYGIVDGRHRARRAYMLSDIAQMVKGNVNE